MTPETSDSPPSRNAWLPRFFLVLAIALLVRLVPGLMVEHVSPDAVELLSIGRNLHETGKPLLSIKAYYYETTPVVHYGGYERPLLPAYLLGVGARLSRSPILGAQCVSLLASLAMLVCLMLFIRRIYGDAAALAAGLIVSLVPSVLIASLYPWSEPLSLLTTVFVLAILATFHRDASSPTVLRGSAAEILVGVAIGLAAAMRPINLLLLLPVGVYFLAMRPTLASRLRACALVLIGPALLLALNATVNVHNGAPPLMLPQGFLYRVHAFSQGIDFWSQRQAAASASGFVMANLPEIAPKVVKQTIAYVYILVFYHQYLFVWWLGLPLLALRMRRLSLHPLTAVALAIAALNLFVYSLSWATYDPLRFLLATLTILIAVCVGEIFQSWGGIRLPLPGNRSVSLPRLLVGGTVVAFGLLAARESYTSFRFHQAGQKVAWGEPGVWSDPAIPVLCRWIDENARPGNIVVASPFPWVTNLLTNEPAAFWPKDLDSPAKLREYLAAYPPTTIVFDPRTRTNDPALPLLRSMPEWHESHVDRFSVFTTSLNK